MTNLQKAQALAELLEIAELRASGAETEIQELAAIAGLWEVYELLMAAPMEVWQP
jgi:hypothetical protein